MVIRKRVPLICSDPSRTKQAFKDECDINKIMQRFKKVQGVDYLTQYNAVAGGQFGDFSNVTDYRTAIDQVRVAQGVFDQLPSAVRYRFQNDPALFLDFVDNPANKQEMIDMGLIDKPVESVAQQQE